MFLGRMVRTRRPSKQMLKLLAVLSAQAQQWRHGYELMKETGLFSGTLYPLLMRMSEQGLVEAQWLEPTQPGRPARHIYRLTADGVALARAIEDDPSAAGLKALPA
jgi:PadR family transcriptional regulator, regulatory protein PadR